MPAKTDHYKLNEHFMRLIIDAKRSVGINEPSLPDKPTMMSLDQRKLRAALLLEEVMELIRDGLGLDVKYIDHYDSQVYDVTHLQPQFVEKGPGDLVDLADGIADVSVVNIGTAIQAGIPDQDLLALVDENNLAKFRPGHQIRADGKLLKPPGHKPPDITGFLQGLGADLAEAT